MTARDPLNFDYGIDFRSAADRTRDERKERMENAARALPYYHAFLDDYLRCIMPHDLVLIGAATGAGKTELVRWIAASNAARGKRVFYFALEAEPNEIERRTKFSVLADLMLQNSVRVPGGFNYADWHRGILEPYIGSLDREADEIIAERYATLHTYYRGSKFDHEDIRRLFLSIQDQADLIVLDHLHYVDIEDDNENRGFKRTVKMIRDVALGMGRPVILVAHLRKLDPRLKSLAPQADDFHGSSDTAKISTRAILLAPAYAKDLPQIKNRANTFFAVRKDRVSGATPLIALSRFDWRAKKYDDNYTLGRPGKGGDVFEALGTDEVPSWAHRHQPLESSLGPQGRL